MSKHPLNLVIRFLLELASVVALGIWGYRSAEGAFGILVAVAAPFLFAVIWGVFAVRGDPSRSGKTVVQTPGIIRLVLELVLFATAAIALFLVGFVITGWIFTVTAVLHYLFSMDRIKWLIKQK